MMQQCGMGLCYDLHDDYDCMILCSLHKNRISQAIEVWSSIAIITSNRENMSRNNNEKIPNFLSGLIGNCGVIADWVIHFEYIICNQ